MRFVKGKYSKSQLDAIKRLPLGSPEQRELADNLIGRASNGEEMSLAEKEDAFGFVRASFDAKTNKKLDISDFPTLQDFDFKFLYTIYNEDLEGKYAIEDVFGDISTEEKTQHVERLNQFYLEWKVVVEKSNHSEGLLNEVATEARRELKELRKIVDRENIDYREIPKMEKAIVLHSKFLYLTVKHFFEENEGNPVLASFLDQEIEINTHSLTHIMFRHYAGSSKQYDTQKSFHFDRGIDYKSLPFILKNIIERIGSSGVVDERPLEYLAFRHRGNPYAIYIDEAEKPIRGKQIKFRRLKTYFPIQDEDEIAKINERDEIRIASDLSVYRKRN